MKTSRVIARARKGVPALRAPREQHTRLLSSAALSSRLPSRTLQRQPQVPSHPIPTLTPQARRTYSEAPPNSPLRKTQLYDVHVRNGAKMVPFGGFHMPVIYADQSVSASHLHTRQHASLFDVGHMVQHRFSGPGATAFLQRITPASVAALQPGTGSLTALLHPGTGGIVDDAIVTKLGDGTFYVVTNAGCREKDLEYLDRELRKWGEEGRQAVEHVVLEDQGLVAVQGPLAERAVVGLLEDVRAADIPGLYFGMVRSVNLKIPTAGGGFVVVKDVLLTRGGYTGEDGFEVSIPPEHTVAVVEEILKYPGVKLAGLGARDSLRLEAGMCLYGHDLDDTTTPVEAALGWIVGKDRREGTDVNKGAFYGADVILKQLTPKSKGGVGVERRRIGLVVDGAPAREGAEILGPDGEKVGKVTSGCPSPSLGKNIAMGYVKDGLHKAGTELKVVVRGKERSALVTKMPFIKTQYWKGHAKE
ncbi:glycine cleavage system T protein [Annulohypoxylon maeteangense]|uniref:glycine cleavage system T protein n=1 Tax=Annulohypoxylon maeteangense TaxID=1927788 RepID=UPI002008203C|nr:glycine cleavage system T protein [Annulohypoxylon maeteangense]KAI0890039.1 glycine cleavage system T protein [Annulohypoxylon maeteangense]